MRSEDGKHFENVMGIIDHDRETGQEFVANVLDCQMPMIVGDSILVGKTVYQYHGEDSLQRSIFTGPAQTMVEVVFGRR